MFLLHRGCHTEVAETMVVEYSYRYQSSMVQLIFLSKCLVCGTWPRANDDMNSLKSKHPGKGSGESSLAALTTARKWTAHSFYSRAEEPEGLREVSYLARDRIM